MNIVCLDMEGVLVPEIWIAFAEESGIPELRRTTRDEPDYDKLMRWRIDLLRQRGLKLSAIQETISRIDPLPGAKDFLDALRKDTQVVILSDTFDQFAMPLMAKLGYPTLLCNTLEVDGEGYITRHPSCQSARHASRRRILAHQRYYHVTGCEGLRDPVQHLPGVVQIPRQYQVPQDHTLFHQPVLVVHRPSHLTKHLSYGFAGRGKVVLRPGECLSQRAVGIFQVR